MKKRKSMLQKSSGIIAKICFLLAVLCAVALYFKVQELGMEHPISASFLASPFFFVFIGFVLTVINNTDIPSFDVVTSKRE
ncbi:MAG: hypothetical protein ACKE8G_03355 [Methylophagaceae bacterium]